MSIAELLLTAGVAMLVIPPSKWPLLAHHLHQALRLWRNLQQKAHQFWQSQLAQYQLTENQAKAREQDMG
jgi:Sec-independent protein translocase protein TatA